MGWLDDVTRGAEFRATSGLRNPATWLVDAFTSGSSSTSGKNVTARQSVRLVAVYGAVNLLAEAVGVLPFKVYRNLDDGSRMEARTSRVWRILHDKPNPLTPANRYWSTVTAQLLLWGNAFLPKMRDPATGLVESLGIPLDPSQMTVQVDANLELKRFVFGSPFGRNTQRVYTDEDLIHVMGMSLDGLIGLSRIAECREAIGSAIAREEFEGNFYRRGATMRGLLKHKRNLSDPARKRLKADWETIYGGSANAHQVAVLEEDMDFQSLTMPLADLQFIETQQLTQTQIAILFGLPPSKLGGSTGDSLTYGNREQDAIEYAQQALLPLTTAIAKALEVDPGLFPQSVFTPEFVFEGLLRADTKTRYDSYASGIEKGWLLRNEVRVMENRPEIPGLDDAPAPTPPQDGTQNGNGTNGAPSGPEALAAMLTGAQG